MKLENRLRNGYNGAKSNSGTLLGALVLYVMTAEQAGQKPTRKGFTKFRGMQKASYGKTVIVLGRALGVIASKGRTKEGTVYTLGPNAPDILAA